MHSDQRTDGRVAQHGEHPEEGEIMEQEEKRLLCVRCHSWAEGQA